MALSDPWCTIVGQPRQKPVRAAATILPELFYTPQVTSSTTKDHLRIWENGSSNQSRNQYEFGPRCEMDLTRSRLVLSSLADNKSFIISPPACLQWPTCPTWYPTMSCEWARPSGWTRLRGPRVRVRVTPTPPVRSATPSSTSPWTTWTSSYSN